MFLFCMCFTIIYQPLGAHASKWFNFEITMFIYIFLASITGYFTIILLKKLAFYSDHNEWNLIKEISFILILFFFTGNSAYFIAFVIEESGGHSRWNLDTYWDSISRAFIIGVPPFVYFAILNAKKLYNSNSKQIEVGDSITIQSNLKKESLNFLSNDFLFAKSEGNYVLFYLFQDEQLVKKSIRNSLSEIETQLSEFNYCIKTHRAYIVNMNQIARKTGNSLGLKLFFENCDETVPVSRQNVKLFNEKFKK